jgi:hypothetical protein
MAGGRIFRLQHSRHTWRDLILQPDIQRFPVYSTGITGMAFN